MSSEATTVTVYTWPYQWVYEPIYYALWKAKESTGITYDFKTNFKDDEDIRTALANHGNQPAIAICEPPANRQGYRLIPVIWRLPLWVFVPKKLRESFDAKDGQSPPGIIPCEIGPLKDWLERSQSSSDMNKPQLYLYPKETTTYRETVPLLEQLFINRPNNSVILPPYGYKSFLELSETYNNSPSQQQCALPIAFTFAPLQFISKHIGAVYESVGGGSQVTAITFDEEHLKKAVFLNFHKHLYDTTRRIIASLYREHDPYKYVQDEFLSHEWNQELSNNGKHLIPPDWCSEKQLRAGLIVGVLRRGIYFPFHILSGLIDREVMHAVKSILNSQVEKIVDSTAQLFTDLLSANEEWTSYSYDQRTKILRKLGKEEFKDCNGVQHLPDSTVVAKDTKRQWVQQIRIKGPRMTLSIAHLVFGGQNRANLVCDGRLTGDVANFCFMQNDGGLVCALCSVLGSSLALTQACINHLKKDLPRLSIDGSFIDENRKKDNSLIANEKFRMSPIHMLELQPFCDAFVKGVDFDSQQEANVRPSLWKLANEEPATDLIFAIEIDKARESHSGEGGTSSRVNQCVADVKKIANCTAWFYWPQGLSLKGKTVGWRKFEGSQYWQDLDPDSIPPEIERMGWRPLHNLAFAMLVRLHVPSS